MDNGELIKTIEDLTEANRNLTGVITELMKGNEELRKQILWLHQALNNLPNELRKIKF
jgi:hypothetical protein